jgi:cytochrome b561
MTFQTKPDNWSKVSITLHWLTVVLIIGMATVGLLMVDMETSPTKLQVYSLHKSFGLTVLGLTVLRLLWRLAAGTPRPVPGISRLQDALARMAHGVMYVLLLAIPISGWWFNSAAGYPLRWFGLFHLPKLTGFDPAIKELAKETHETLFWILAVIILVHATAALWHHYRNKNRTLVRMLPLLKPPTKGF